jgi:hypothetical protein
MARRRGQQVRLQGSRRYYHATERIQSFAVWGFVENPMGPPKLVALLEH